VIVLHSGVIVIDWGDDSFQDVHSGEFIHCKEDEISHHIQDDELDVLMHSGKVDRYDAKFIYVLGLPERHQRTIE
jgi:hypothetical protein